VKGDRLYLGHFLEAIDRILDYAKAGEENFKRDLKTQDAIVRNLQVLGEAVKNVSADTRTAHPEVPWKDIAGMRDRVVHDYFGVSLTIVWDVITKHLPPLRDRIQSLLEQHEERRS
jgi:uncharacterized protein with HEPN domain